MLTPVAFVDEGLGNSSYLVDMGDGRAMVIDPARHPALYVAEAQRRGLAISHALETHLHADFVSGARELAALGAAVIAPRAAAHGFAVRGLRDADEIDLGTVRLRALGTPGHTPEHLAYVLLDGADPVALFSGGSLLVDAVARTDLIAPGETEPLARQLWRSIHERILTLPAELPVYPTHGGGSFCAAPVTDQRTTTIARERAANPLLAAADEDDFVRRLFAGLGSYPPYFHRLRDVNRAGPRLYGPDQPSLPLLPASDVASLHKAGIWIVDARPAPVFAQAHIPGSVSIALRPQFATWLGWIIPEDAAIVFVLDPAQDKDDLIRQARNVGYEKLLGVLAGGIDAWRAEGLEVGSLPTTGAAEVAAGVIDVRQASEFVSGHIPGAINIELGSLSAASLPDGPIAVMCGHGERAATAASILTRRGRADVTLVHGGPGRWAKAHGTLETGA